LYVYCENYSLNYYYVVGKPADYDDLADDVSMEDANRILNTEDDMDVNVAAALSTKDGFNPPLPSQTPDCPRGCSKGPDPQSIRPTSLSSTSSASLSGFKKSDTLPPLYQATSKTREAAFSPCILRGEDPLPDWHFVALSDNPRHHLA
jgi:hypothetical protein